MDRKYRVSYRASLQPDSGLDDEQSEALREFTAAQATREYGFRHRRMLLAAIAALIVITGLLVHFAIRGVVADFVGDALYAVLVYLVVSFILVRRSSWHIALIAVLFCVAIELLQLTGLPDALAEVFPPSRYLLGTTFSTLDLVAYIVGVGTAAAVSSWRKLD
jgi:uncharacterized membrane protein YdbT with pleckstrin-like domain